jgi:hypothetical protein
MRYFAELDENNVVVNAFASENDADLTLVQEIQIEDENGTVTTQVVNIFPENHTIIEFSDDGSITKNYAGIGYTYDNNLNAFIPPKEYENYILNEETFEWEPDENLEYDLHNDGKLYRYSKELDGWIPVDSVEVEPE